MTKQHVRNILENYSKYKAMSVFCNENGVEVDKRDVIDSFRIIDKYINEMEVSLQMVIKMLYVQGYSIRKCAKECHFCYKTIIRKRDKAIEELLELLKLVKLSTSCPKSISKSTQSPCIIEV